MSHVVVLMGSPRRNGNTAHLTEAFVQGACQKNTVELLYPAELQISPCRGCNACLRHPENRCVQQDDMALVYRALSGADTLVIATPLYFYSVTAQLKLLIDRLHNPLRNQFPIRQLVLLAVAGNDDPAVFRPLLAMYQQVLSYFRLRDGGVLTVAGVRHAEALHHHPALEQAKALGSRI